MNNQEKFKFETLDFFSGKPCKSSSADSKLTTEYISKVKSDFKDVNWIVDQINLLNKNKLINLSADTDFYSKEIFLSIPICPAFLTPSGEDELSKLKK